MCAQLLIRVVDLNADAERRNEILNEKPPWLGQEMNPEAYLRGRVLVSVSEKFHIEVLDANQAVRLTVPGAASVDD